MSSPVPSWPIGLTDQVLAAHDVHVWSLGLDPVDRRLAVLRTLLSQDEIARAERFKFERHRRRFIAARGTLREILGCYFDDDPKAIDFLTTKYGKPFVRRHYDGQEFNFNLSHSHELALLAVTLAGRVGVDLEHRRTLVDLESIARHFFSSAEIDSLLNVPVEQRHDAFLNCWTRKEAYIKGLGQGLSHPLSTFQVTLAMDTPARLLADDVDPEAPERWKFTALHPHPDYIAAITVESPQPVTFSTWHWPR